MGIKFETSNIDTSNLTSNIPNNYDIKPISVSSSSYVNNITSEGQINKVIVQADFPYRKNIKFP